MKFFCERILFYLALISIFSSVCFAGDRYHLGPRDIISISIFAGGEQQVAVDLTISDSGYVNFPFIGSVKAAGISSADLEKAVTATLAQDYFVAPQVHIQMKEYHSLNFAISGAVKKPGKYEMEGTTTIMDLIAKAEGVTLDSGNIAYIMHNSLDDNSKRGEKNNSEPIKVNLVKLLDKGDMSSNITLQSGDSIYIPFGKGLNQSESKVYVSGEVEKPALYDYNPGLTALSVCIMAGGFAKYAAPNRTTIIRMENGEQKIIKINLDDVVKGSVSDVELKPGDRVNVPESWL